MRQCDAAEKGTFFLVRYRLGKTPKLGFQKAYYLIYINKVLERGTPNISLNYKLARNGFSAVVACCLQARKSLFRLSSLSPF